MSTYYANKVHKSWNSSGTHQHIEFVCQETSGTHWTPGEVVASIELGNEWRTRGTDGSSARIKPLQYCPAPSCLTKPYITTTPDHTTANNLDNLLPC
jgi:hypothetical protein